MISTLVLAAAAEVAALQPIVGTWKNSDAAEKTEVISRCDWSPGHKFVICDQEGTVQGNPFTALSIYGWSEAQKGYIFYGAQNGGPANTTRLSIEGKVWTYLPPEGGKFKTENDFSGKDSYTYKVMVSEDGKTWKVVKSGSSKRVK